MAVENEVGELLPKTPVEYGQDYIEELKNGTRADLGLGIRDGVIALCEAVVGGVNMSLGNIPMGVLFFAGATTWGGFAMDHYLDYSDNKGRVDQIDSNLVDKEGE